MSSVVFSNFTLSPTALDSEHDQVSYQGQVVKSGTDQGVPNHQVILREYSRDTDLGTVTTDSQGRFSGTVRIDQSMQVYAFWPSDGMYGEAWTDPATVDYRQLPTMFTVSNWATGVIGETTSLPGRLTRKDATGEWAGLGGAPVQFTSPSGAVTEVTTKSDGTFDGKVLLTGDGQWQVDFSGRVPGAGPYGPSSLTTGYIDARWRPSVRSFDAAPEPVAKGATITGTGQVVRKTATGGEEPAPQVTLAMQFSPDGKNWSTRPAGSAGADGRFSLGAAAARDGYWRVTVQDPDYVPTSGSSDYVDTKYGTAITGFAASPKTVRTGHQLRITGTLKRKTTSWKAYAKRTIRIYFRAKGSKKWTYAGSATTDGKGRFARSLTAKKDGTWRAKFSGDSACLAVTGASVYVDVR
ncbi:hypothetical protein [Actinoallomurus rhizosphaericola]|uniref:hypothetical protein n=1 Tax=Actinoallomurus rhizosphaericola TaxID=2952536 RepID=UPI00209241BA|nr:hypothetical protein [Actinoallomurus rhizosphaericola]MCO5996715.1 hypothetical protein [Actinoallomurus rhizosphaericola]